MEVSKKPTCTQDKVYRGWKVSWSTGETAWQEEAVCRVHKGVGQGILLGRKICWFPLACVSLEWCSDSPCTPCLAHSTLVCAQFDVLHWHSFFPSFLPFIHPSFLPSILPSFPSSLPPSSCSEWQLHSLSLPQEDTHTRVASHCPRPACLQQGRDPSPIGRCLADEDLLLFSLKLLWFGYSLHGNPCEKYFYILSLKYSNGKGVFFFFF